MKHGQELDGGDAEILEVGNLVYQPGIGAPLLRGDSRAGMTREASDVQLVDHGLDQGPPERSIALPVVAVRVGNDAFHGCGAIVAWPCRSPAIVCLGHGYGETIRIEKHLLAIEAKSIGQLIGSVRSVGIHLPGLQRRHKDMPVVVRTVFVGVERNDPRRLPGILIIEQEQLYQCRALGIDAEVDAARANCSAERSAFTRCNDVGGRSWRVHARPTG